MELLALSPMSANQDLYVIKLQLQSFPGSDFNQPIFNYLVSTNKVICLIDPHLSPKEGGLT